MRKQSAKNKPFQLRKICSTLLLVFAARNTLANPVDPSVVAGQASFVTNGNTLTVTNTPGTIINWQGFSIGANEITRFVQQSSSSAVLNRVVGSNPSSILGTLQSNGRVYLVNPNGIVFGAGATIDVAGLVFSTLDISNADFLAGRLKFIGVPGAANISNAGNITAQTGGEIYLIAPNVENTGIITAPNGEILLAAGHSVELVDTSNPNLRVNITAPAGEATNLGQLVADSGSLGLFGTMVRNSGKVSADSATMQGGKIVFRASQRSEISGTVSANGTSGGTIQVLGQQVGIMDGATVSANGAQGGGTVLVGGDYQGKNPDVPNAQVTYVAPTATISADATDNGNGGKVIVWGNDTVRAYGSLSARGGINGGNGGLIETSAHWLDLAGVKIDAAAPRGSAGTWLLDPWDLVVDGTATTAAFAGGTWSSGSGATNVLNTDINTKLDLGTNVILQTTGTAGDGNGNGDITVNAAITKTTGAATTLSLQAHNDIVINQGISSSSGALNVNLTADSDANNAGAIFINKQINSNGGNIVATAYGNIQLNDGVSTNLLAGSGNATLTSSGGSIEGSPAGGPLDILANTVSLNAKNGIAANGGSAEFYVDAANISFNNTTSGGVIISNDHAAGPSTFTGTNSGGPVRLDSSYSGLAAVVVNSITSAGNIVFRMNKLAIAGPVNAGANTVYLAPMTNGPISIDGADTFNLTGGGISAITAGKIVVGYDTYGNYVPTVNIGTTTTASITNTANLEVIGSTVNVGALGITNAGGQVALVGDTMNLGGPINSGSVWLKGKSFSQHIDLGGADAAGTLGLTAAELSQVTANTLRIGSLSGTGNVNVSSAISPAGVSNLSLEAGGNVSQAVAGNITVPNLAVKSLGDVTLDQANNNVTNVAGQVGDATHQNNNFRFKSGSALNVGNSIDGISGININIDGTNYNPASPNGVIALTSSNALTQSAGTLAGKAVYAEGSRVTLTNANPTGVIAGKTTGVAAGDIFNYNSSNGILVTTVNGFSGIQAAGAADPASIVLTAGSAGITQDASGIITTPSGLSLNTSGPVNLNVTANNVAALATVVNTNQFNFNNSGALTLGISANGITTTNQPVNIVAGGLLTVKNPVNAGTGGVNLDAPNIQLGSASGTTITGGQVKLRANLGSTGTISSAGGVSTVNSTNLVMDADNFSFPLTPVFNATNAIEYRTVTDNRNISVSALGGATNNSPWLVIGNDTVGDTNTTGDIAVDAAINRAGQGLVLMAGGSISQTAAIVAQNLATFSGSVAGTGGNTTLNLGNQVVNLAAKTSGGAFSYTNATGLNIATITDGKNTASGITTSNGAVDITTSAGNITLTSPINAGSGAMSLTSSAGTIVDGDGDAGGVPVTNLFAGNATLTASGDIGTATDPIEIQAATLTASSTTGSVYTSMTGAVAPAVVTTVVNSVVATSGGDLLVPLQDTALTTDAFAPAPDQNGENNQDEPPVTDTQASAGQTADTKPAASLPVCK